MRILRWLLDLFLPEPFPRRRPQKLTFAVRGCAVYVTNERGDAVEVGTVVPGTRVAAWLDGRVFDEGGES